MDEPLALATQEIANRIREGLPKVKRGSLRFWGVCFGRPHDNWHTLTGCKAEGDCLSLAFDGGESLVVWSPGGLSLDDSIFQIKTATRVRWEWFYYGRPQLAENLRFMDFERSGRVVTANTNTEFSDQPLKPKVSNPAVELL